MREKTYFFLNTLFFILATYFFVVLQVSFRPFQGIPFLEALPAPINWLPPLVFLSLYRRPLEGVLISYILVLSLLPMTVAPPGTLLFLALAVFVSSQLIKTRVFWPGPNYFMILSAISVLVLQVVAHLLPVIFEDHPLTLPPVFSWFAQSILTSLIAFPYFFILNFIDGKTDKEPLTEYAGEAF